MNIPGAGGCRWYAVIRAFGTHPLLVEGGSLTLGKSGQG